MSKEKNQSNKKNTPKKKTEKKVTDTKITKANKNGKKITEETSKIKVYDTVEEAYEELDENTNIEEDFDGNLEEELDEDLEETLEEDFTEDSDENFDEETTEDLEEVEEEIKIKEVKKSSKEKKKKEKEKNKEDKIQKIERLAKEKKSKTSNNNKFRETLLLLDQYRYSIYAFIGGVLLTVLIAMLIWPDRIAALKNGEEPVVKVGKVTYTADELYENMKDYYSVNLLLDQIDNDLLTKLYPEDDKMLNEVNSNAEYYLNLYQQYYGYTQEEFLSANGFSDYNEFLDYLKLDYRRTKYLDDYVAENITDKEIEEYYNENVYGDINTQHVLVEVSATSDEDEGLTDEEAKKLAEEIITKLNDGTAWETIQEEYKDQITYEDLSYQSWNASLEESFMTALKNMENNSYSEEPVKTSYGYHVIYRLDQKEAPSLDDAKETIIDTLVTEKEAEDSNLLYKALISLREENNIEFSDTVMKSKYETYCDQYK